MHQAALELREQEAAHEVTAALNGLIEPSSISAWWWLLPPVAYWLQRRRSRRYRQSAMENLTPEEFAVLVDYINKATGWLLVGLGGFLIAVKETWEVHELYEWPTWVFVVLVVVALGVCLIFTASRVQRGQQLIEQRSAPDRSKG